MLTRLLINNVVLIEKLELEFSKGLTIFSGETGAGKSILLDSLGLILGARAETGLIRHGAEKLCVVGTFELEDKKSPFFQICAENEIEVDDEIIIKRTLTTDAKSKIFLNDQQISLKLLKELGSYLVEIHGQFDNQGLLNPQTHIDVLDSFGGYDKKLLEVQDLFKKFKDTQKKLKNAVSLYEKAQADEETLSHYKTELENMNVREGEEAELNQKRTEMMHAEKLIENLNTAYQALHGQGLAQEIRHAMGAIEKVNRITDGKYQAIADALDSSLVELDEAVAQIESASEDISLNANDINSVEERLFALKALARKHNCTIDELPDTLEQIKKKLNDIQISGDEIIELKKEIAGVRKDYMQKALELHESREKAAQNLSLKVGGELSFLNMGKAEFKVNITKLDEEDWHEKGMDLVCFEAKTNAGQPFSALNKIASGGELARFMLALKVNLAKKSGMETLIFDEIDSGIGGKSAEAVGNRLYKLSKDVQVMAVTHSPQVAAFSTTHFMVSKETKGEKTTTSVQKLTSQEKKEEIARMLSGETITDEARAAAEKLIKPEQKELF
ncbi:MAG: DNA repair protein RecN [Alphaproteobacteria bacterium]|nr:DNA repair protein RecN [Alphaproteobacteria bacterium]